MSEHLNFPAVVPLRHSLAEDIHAILIGSSFCGFGLMLLKGAGLSTGGLAGIALVISYVTDLPAGPAFVTLNLPFLVLARRHLGVIFTIKSLTTMVLVGVFYLLIPHWVELTRVLPAFSAVFGGSLLGIAVLSLARHRASIGGIGILALHLQERHGANAGLVQMLLDVVIVSSAACVLDMEKVGYSALSAVCMNLVMFAYHRPGRYAGS